MAPLSAVKTLDLNVIKFNAAAYLDRYLMEHTPRAIEFIMRDLPEQMARQLIAQLKVPAQVLQENRLIHRHPATLWDHIKQRIGAYLPGLKRWLAVRYLEIRLTEYLVYPTVQVPKTFDDKVRLHVYPEFDTSIQ